MRKSDRKIVNFDKAFEQRQKWNESNEKVVFTNGCFDIIHLGHIDYLEKSRSLGDRLIVAVNSDDSVKRLKGKNRPIVNEQARLRMMAAFEFVDLVLKFEDDTPFNLIENLLPDILVKGKDYTVSNIVGADVVMQNGGKVETIDIVEGYSTSGIIDKIKNQ